MRLRDLLLPCVVLVLLSAPLAAEDATATREFHVSGMTCGLCARAIEKGLREVDGVREVEVDRDAERVRVVASRGVTAATLEAAIEGAGAYEAEPVEPSTLQ